jgi:hypothetical protein
MGAMLERLLKVAAILLSVTVGLGWLLFAIDETAVASRDSAIAVAGDQASAQPDPEPEEERARERAHNSVREGIDDANDLLLKPFAALVQSNDSTWVRRTIPAGLGLILYGFVLGFVARYARGRV